MPPISYKTKAIEHIRKTGRFNYSDIQRIFLIPYYRTKILRGELLVEGLIDQDNKLIEKELAQ